MIFSFALFVNMSELVIIDSFFLPVWACGFIKSKHTESLFVSAACAIVVSLCVLVVGILRDELIRIELYLEILLSSDDFMFLGVVDSRLEECRQQFKFLPLLLKLVRLDGAGLPHQLIELAWAIWIFRLLLFFRRWTIWRVKVSQLGKSFCVTRLSFLDLFKLFV